MESKQLWLHWFLLIHPTGPAKEEAGPYRDPQELRAAWKHKLWPERGLETKRDEGLSYATQTASANKIKLVAEKRTVPGYAIFSWPSLGKMPVEWPVKYKDKCLICL